MVTLLDTLQESCTYHSKDMICTFRFGSPASIVPEFVTPVKKSSRAVAPVKGDAEPPPPKVKLPFGPPPLGPPSAAELKYMKWVSGPNLIVCLPWVQETLSRIAK